MVLKNIPSFQRHVVVLEETKTILKPKRSIGTHLNFSMKDEPRNQRYEK
jgi:hypothetical protein